MAPSHSQQVKDSVYGVFLDQEFVQVSTTEVPLIATSWKKTSLVTADIEKHASCQPINWWGFSFGASISLRLCYNGVRVSELSGAKKLECTSGILPRKFYLAPEN